MHFMGLAGVPRRYYQFTLVKEFDVWMDVNKLITVSAIAAGIAQLFFLWNFFYSIFRGKKAGTNPWQATTLEWSTPEERIHGNWPGEIPTVYRGPHEYSRPDREEDFFPQYIPDESDLAQTETQKTKTAPSESEVEETESASVFFAAIKRVFGLS
jgi:cytochrome c oxidase subunit 1